MVTINNSTNTSAYLTHSFTGKTSRGTTISSDHVETDVLPHHRHRSDGDGAEQMNENRQDEHANESTHFKIDDGGDDDFSKRKCFLSTSLEQTQRYQLKISLSYNQDLTKYVFMEQHAEHLPR
jgi:hypothetical protein